MKLSDKRSNKKQLFVFIMCGLFLLLSSVWYAPRIVHAETISYDAYADSVAGTTPTVTSQNNAVGAPNGQSASLLGPGASITLDMGAGEEGTQTLRLHLGQISLLVNVNVAFLDNDQAVITSENRPLGIDLNPSVQNFAYNWTSFNKAYRFVRISSTVGVNVDAVEALGYIGSTPTQDTDGDGRPDRSEQEKGTDPLVPDPAPSDSKTPPTPIPGSTGSSNNSGGSNSNNKKTAPGVSEQVNTPPAANNDQDGDGMADDWERTYKLDPSDPSDATKDADYDELNNFTEYKINSNPLRTDTDGDGMPDKWEYTHGLDITKNDANGDPDGDFLTNLGEYRHGADPNKADNLKELFGGRMNALAVVGLSALGMLLLCLLVALMRRDLSKVIPIRTKKNKKKNGKKSTKWPPPR
ncbi:MAG TPA: hypothetical protein VJ836_04680 [Candidatus Saccharimonadales bacterium]|nr:hypothetical protein [Candidatus Saccharimonadales bacterium]